MSGMPTLVLYHWRVWDPVRSRWRTTRYLATEEEMRKRHERYEVILRSREVRQIKSGEALTAGYVQRGYGQKE